MPTVQACLTFSHHLQRIATAGSCRSLSTNMQTFALQLLRVVVPGIATCAQLCCVSQHGASACASCDECLCKRSIQGRGIEPP